MVCGRKGSICIPPKMALYVTISIAVYPMSENLRFSRLYAAKTTATPNPPEHAAVYGQDAVHSISISTPAKAQIIIIQPIGLTFSLYIFDAAMAVRIGDTAVMMRRWQR